MVLNELPAVLMWREENEYVKALTEFSEKYAYDPDLYYRESDNYLFGKIKTKNEFIRRIEDYAANATLSWQGQATPHCDAITQDDINNALQYGTYNHGESLRRHYSAMSWAFHLDDYAKTVNRQGSGLAR